MAAANKNQPRRRQVIVRRFVAPRDVANLFISVKFAESPLVGDTAKYGRLAVSIAMLGNSAVRQRENNENFVVLQ